MMEPSGSSVNPGLPRRVTVTLRPCCTALTTWNNCRRARVMESFIAAMIPQLLERDLGICTTHRSFPRNCAGARDANPKDALCFLTLRRHEVGMIKSTPQKLTARGTDWQFLNGLKKELKA